ncbi:DUF2786 domain-containing protein [soil metagenome]
MGKNSKRRREARRRRTTGSSTGPQPQAAGGEGSPLGQEAADVEESSVFVELQVATELIRIGEGRLRADLRGRAADLVRRLEPLPAPSLRRVVDEVVARIIESRVASGWCPDDFDQLLLREGVPTDRPVLAAWLRADLRTSDPDGVWRDQVERFDPGAVQAAGDVSRIAAAMHLGALLQAQNGLPVITTRRTRRGVVQRAATPADSELTRKLATVRGLLAKAESTTFDEEAEALSAKAQQLISRYALERLIDDAASGATGATGADIAGPTARRVWLEPPYVGAKAQLVHVVALANACRAVYSDPPGVCTVVGADADLDAVELLVTSLLVQAGSAMLRHGRAVDAAGTSRTRSFRQSFLMAFAMRIGERLSETAEQVLHDSGHEAALLPVLRSREEAVEAAFEALVPNIRTKTSTVSNGAGWRAGQAAADRASLDVRRRIAEGDERAG